MFNLSVSQELDDYVNDLIMVRMVNFGRRCTFNGNKTEQITGIIGQSRVQDEFGLPWVDGKSGCDHGTDLAPFGVTIDVKTMGRTKPVIHHPEWINNFTCLQAHFCVDALLFASLMRRERVLTVCGWLPKHLVITRGHLYRKVEIRYKGSVPLEMRADNIEIHNYDLFDVTSMDDLKRQLKDYSDALGRRHQAAPLLGNWSDRFERFNLD